ncbi:hypothetical protein BHM03_00008637 [Ensete ventricosum]|nr:hypothetical protein BHM03_00008637 [Ensete ventricosum]
MIPWFSFILYLFIDGCVWIVMRHDPVMPCNLQLELGLLFDLSVGKEKKKKGAPHLPPSSSPAPAIGRRRLSHCLPYYCPRPPFPLLPATTAGHHTPISSIAAADTPVASSHRSSLSSSATHNHRSQPSSLSHNRCHPSSTASIGHLCHPFSSPLLSRRPPSPSPPQPQPQPHPPRPLLHLRTATFFLRCPVTGRCLLLFPYRCCLLLSHCRSPCRTVAALFLPTLLSQPSPLPSLPPMLPLPRLLLPPSATAVPPLHHRRPSMPFPTAAAATHYCNLLLIAAYRPPSHSRLQPSVAHTHTVTPLPCFTPSCSSPATAATLRGPLPAILPRCRCFPAASSALLLSPTPSSSSVHSSAASASCCRSAFVPLSLLPPPPCCCSRLQPCPPHLLPFVATSAATTPRWTPLLVGLLLLPRRTPLLARTHCPSLLSTSP